MKLTQRQLDRVSASAYNIKTHVEEQRCRLNGQGLYVGEEVTDVFTKLNDLNGAPNSTLKKLKKSLQDAEDALQMAAMYAEEIETWADDAEPT